MMNMIKNKLVGAVCVLGAVSMLAVAGASASTVGINPDIINVPAATPVSATVEADFSDVPGGTAQGGITVFWNAAVLTLNESASGLSTDITSVITAQLIASGFTDSGFAFESLDQAAGSLSVSFSLCTLSSGCDALSVFNMYDLVFDTVPGVSNVDVGLSIIGDVWWDSTGAAPLTTQPTLSGATVTVNAVPVPAAVWLFGSGLLGMIGVARRRS